MANKIVKVTSPSVVTGDTLASYNVYTDKPSAKTLVGTMTPAEASAGKTLAFADGLNHNVSVYPVGTTTGEFNEESNVVVVDLIVTNYKMVFDGPTDQESESSLDFPQITGVLKAEFKCPLLPVTNSNNIFTINAIFRVGYYGGNLIIGNTAGFDNYPIAGLEGTDLVVTFDQTTFVTTVTSNGSPVTLGSTSGTKGSSDTTGLLKIPTNIAAGDDVEIEYFRLYDDSTLLAQYDMNDGSGLTIVDSSGNNRDLTIDVGTGVIGTIWVSL